MISFKGHRYPKEVILQTVRWYLAYTLSTRNLEEMLLERGISVDHSTINDWVLKFSPMLAEAFQKKKRKPGSRLRFDETYIKIKGKALNNITLCHYQFKHRLYQMIATSSKVMCSLEKGQVLRQIFL